MVIGQLATSGRLGHDPLRGSVVVVPGHVIDHVRGHVDHPAHGVGIDGVDLANRAGGDDLLDLRVVLSITMLVRDHSLHLGIVDGLADFDGFVHRERDRFFVRDELRTRLNANLDQRQADSRRRAEAEHVRFEFLGEGKRIGRRMRDLQLFGYLLEEVGNRICDPDHLEARILLESGNMVLSALAYSDDYNFVGLIRAHFSPGLLAVLFVPLDDLGDRVIDFFLGQLGKHGQRNALCGIALCLRHAVRNRCQLAPRVAFLLVDGNGVVHLGVDAFIVEKLIEARALGGLNHIEVIDVAVARNFNGQLEAGALQAFGVALCPLAALVAPLGDVLEFHAQDASVNVIEAAVESEAVHRTLQRAVIAQALYGGGNIFAVGDERAAVAKGSEVLLDDEAGADGIAQFALLETVAVGVDGLCVIFYNPELVLLGDGAHRLHIGAVSVEVDGNDTDRLRGDGGFDLAGVDVVG